MYYPNKKEFIRDSKKGMMIPVYREIIDDTETPVSQFSKIMGKYSFLLESVEGGEKIARYSFLGCDPKIVFKSKGTSIQIIYKNGSHERIEKLSGNPFEHLRTLIKKYEPHKIEGLPRFHGGAVGYIGYDMVRFIEEIPDKNPDDLKLPDCQFMIVDTIIAFDHVKHKIIIISNAFIDDDPGLSYKKAVKKIENVIKKIKKNSKVKPVEIEKYKKSSKIISNTSKEKFIDSVEKAKDYIKAGDVIQVVLSQRFKSKISIPPFDIYRMLRTINPSPYMFYIQFDGLKLIGSSPEIMVTLEGSIANIRPIAGTRPRGLNEEEDSANQKELLNDEKEKAEHIMLVDLARNDLGRVCESGSVNISKFMEVEKYSHVMHIVSNVSGRLKKDKDAFALLKASFPAGTVSGAPKVRAMEIIEELESVKRGPYAGAVGYFDFYGGLDTCIAIRTIIVKNDEAYVQAGAGIVLDSNPESEYRETQNKAFALLKALGLS